MESPEEKNYLRAGDIVWITQTEKKVVNQSSKTHTQSDSFVHFIKAVHHFISPERPFPAHNPHEPLRSHELNRGG